MEFLDNNLIRDLSLGSVLTNHRGRKYVRLQDGGRQYMLKITPDAADEYRAIQILEDVFRDAKTFKVPEYQFLGEYEGKGSLLVEFFPNDLGHKRLTVDGDVRFPDNFSEYIPRIIDVCFELSELGKDIETPFDPSFKERSYHSRAINWSKNILDKHPELETLVAELIELSAQTDDLPKAFSHGLVWQDKLALNDAGDIILFDFDRVTGQRPALYDAIFFIHRLYTALEHPEHAGDAWNHLMNKHPSFPVKGHMHPILAQRAIGGLLDATYDKRLSMELAIDFARNFRSIFSE